MKYNYLFILLLISTSAWCDENKFYVGGEIASAKLSDNGMGDFQSMDNTTGAIHLFGGYQFTPVLAAEVAIDGMGSYEGSTPSSDIYNDYSAFTVSALGRFPLGQYFSIYGQLGFGLASIYQDITAVSGPNLIYGSHSDTNFASLWGAGVSYVFPMMKELELRAGGQKISFSIDAYSIDNASNLIHKNYDQSIQEFYLGVAYRFN